LPFSGNKKPSGRAPQRVPDIRYRNDAVTLPHPGETLLSLTIIERAHIFGPQILQHGASRLIMAHCFSRFHFIHPQICAHCAWRGDI